MKKTRKLLSTFLVLTMLITVFIPAKVEAATKYEYASLSFNVESPVSSAADADYRKAGGKYFGAYAKSDDVYCICYKNSKNGKPKTLYKMPKGYKVGGLLTNGANAYFVIYKDNMETQTIKACSYSFKTGKTEILKTITTKDVCSIQDVSNYYDGKVYFNTIYFMDFVFEGVSTRYIDVKNKTIKKIKNASGVFCTASNQERFAYIMNFDKETLKKYDCKTNKVVATKKIDDLYGSYFACIDKNIYLRKIDYSNEFTLKQLDLDLKNVKVLCKIKNVVDVGFITDNGKTLYVVTGTYNQEKYEIENLGFKKYEIDTGKLSDITEDEYDNEHYKLLK